MKDIYAWVPWFNTLAQKIAEGGEVGLIRVRKPLHYRNCVIDAKGDALFHNGAFCYPN